MYKHCCSVFRVAKITRDMEGGGKRLTLQCRNPTGLATAMWESLPSSVIGHVDSMYPWYDVMNIAASLCGFLPQDPQLQSNH